MFRDGFWLSTKGFQETQSGSLYAACQRATAQADIRKGTLFFKTHLTEPQGIIKIP